METTGLTRNEQVQVRRQINDALDLAMHVHFATVYATTEDDEGREGFLGCVKEELTHAWNNEAHRVRKVRIERLLRLLHPDMLRTETLGCEAKSLTLALYNDPGFGARDLLEDLYDLIDEYQNQ